jgi:hypothetical protein
MIKEYKLPNYPRLGSIKNKIVAEDLIEERAKCNFDQKELTIALYGG